MFFFLWPTAWSSFQQPSGFQEHYANICARSLGNAAWELSFHSLPPCPRSGSAPPPVGLRPDQWKCRIDIEQELMGNIVDIEMRAVSTYWLHYMYMNIYINIYYIIWTYIWIGKYVYYYIYIYIYIYCVCVCVRVLCVFIRWIHHTFVASKSLYLCHPGSYAKAVEEDDQKR